MRRRFKHIIVLVSLLLFLLPITSNASWSDLKWRIKEGDKIHYMYQGWLNYIEHINGTSVELTGHLQEEVYFVIEDLWGIPIPSVDGPSISVSPYWENGTPFGDDFDESVTGWIAKSIDKIDEIAVRVGNWTLYTEQAEVYWTSLEPGFFDVTLNETSKVWNITISVSWFEDYLSHIVSYSYSKFDGVLNYGNFTYYKGSEDDPLYSISLSRIIAPPILQHELVIGAAAVAAVLVLIIIIVEKRR
ncbi:MAG: hypothetical protein ACFFDQ_06155 [Candidatus Thorarchaeota archaeon]